MRMSGCNICLEMSTRFHHTLGMAESHLRRGEKIVGFKTTHYAKVNLSF